MPRRALLLAACAALLLAADAPEPLNGFDVSKATVPAGSILPGGPPRDGIRSVDAPEFVPSADASWVGATTAVLGVSLGGEAKAYPVHLLEYHQVVNDGVGGVPVAVSYDPVAGVPRAFRRRLGERTLELGVSGLVHNSSFLLYDRQTGSLWLQWTGEAIAGPLSGEKLERIPVRQEIRDVWLARHPDSKILARPEPQKIDYRYSPYEAHWVSEKLPFPVAAEDRRYHPKELVVGVRVGDVTRAYLGSVLTAAGGRAVDEIAGRRIQVDYDTNLAAFAWEVAEGVDVTEAYWFAWKAFHPDTQVWKPESPAAP